MIITTSREVYVRSAQAGFIDILTEFGAEFITDTCWCLVEEPVIPLDAKNLMKYSAKYAHYGPGTTKRGIHFGSLKAYVDTTVGGTIERVMPSGSS
jgi:predicted aconitase